MLKVGLSILTNGKRLDNLQTCVSSFLTNCYFRPLVVAVFDNGSKDDTFSWLQERKANPGYAIGWRIERSERDVGCAAGVNRVSRMVDDCDYVVHVESDFRHLPFSITGVDGYWLHRALDFMQDEDCDYLYLRRMMTERDIAQHWWAQWFARVTRIEGDYIDCPSFWWSNNPHLRLNRAIWDAGCLPLDESIDGPKGSVGWSKPELSAPKPSRPWIHKWGLFVHEAPSDEELLSVKGCPLPGGCKYGFFLPGPAGNMFCQCCNLDDDFTDMQEHYDKFRRMF